MMLNYKTVIILFVTITVITVLWASGTILTDKGQTPDGDQNTTQHKFMISAHRGASRYAPENTLAAFSKAMEMGADFIEVDVRTTADSVQVCLHDGSLKRTTGLDAAVKNSAFDDIRKLSAGQWFGQQYAAEKVPTLEEVCALVKTTNTRRSGNVKLYVDCKDIRVKEVVALLDQYDLLDSAVFYGDVDLLAEIKAAFAAARVMPSYPDDDDKVDGVIRKIHPYAFDVPWDKADSRMMIYCQSRKIKVFVDLLGKQDMRAYYIKAMDAGVDLIQTDDITSVQQTMNDHKNLQGK